MMKIRYARKGGVDYRFKAPTDNAYRIRLTRIDGDDGADFVIVGADQAVSQNLNPGKYHVIMDGLGASADSLVGRLELTHDQLEIDLAELNVGENVNSTPALYFALKGTKQIQVQSRRNSILHQAYGTPRITKSRAYLKTAEHATEYSMKEIAKPERLEQAMSDEGNSETQGSVKFFNKNLGFGFIHSKELNDLSVTIEPITEIAARGFSIGMSTNTPETGWKSADPVDISIDEDENGGLWFTFDGLTQDWESRYRVTISIQGLPAIRIPVIGLSGGTRIGIFPELKQGVLDFNVTVSAVDSRMQALLTALTRLDSEGAQKVLEWVLNEVGSVSPILFEKYKDPWAATLAAIIMVRSGEIKKYTKWVYNLARISRHISDASILAAWACTLDDQYNAQQIEIKSLDYLLRAHEIGTPNFVQTNSMALDLLDSLSETATDKKVRDKARIEKSKRARRSRSRVFNGPIFIWEERNRYFKSGLLPNRRYNILKAGMLKGSKWS